MADTQAVGDETELVDNSGNAADARQFGGSGSSLVSTSNGRGRKRARRAETEDHTSASASRPPASRNSPNVENASSAAELSLSAGPAEHAAAVEEPESPVLGRSAHSDAFPSQYEEEAYDDARADMGAGAGASSSGAGAGSSSAHGPASGHTDSSLSVALSFLSTDDLMHILEYLGGVDVARQLQAAMAAEQNSTAGASSSAGASAGAGASSSSTGPSSNNKPGANREAILLALSSNFSPDEIGMSLAQLMAHLKSARTEVIELLDDDDDDDVIVDGEGYGGAGAGTSSSARRPGNNSSGRGVSFAGQGRADDDDEVEIVGAGGSSSAKGSGSRSKGLASSRAISIRDDDDDVVVLVSSQGEEEVVARSGSGAGSRSALYSSSIMVQEEVPVEGTCGICYDEPCTLQKLGQCSHSVCRGCALRTIRMQLKPGAESLPCPLCEAEAPSGAAGSSTKPSTEVKSKNITGKGYISSACVTVIEQWSNGVKEEDLGGERPLSSDEVARFNAMLVKYAITNSGADGAKIITCPNPKCGESMETESMRPSDVACPACGTHMCAACGMDWKASEHSGRSCQDTANAISIEKDAAELADSEVANTFKRCPVCGTGCEHRRGHGCHHLTCAEPTCKAHWCWVCCGPFPCSRGCPGWCNNECDCIPCLDCKKSKACSTCSGTGGGCPTCLGQSQSTIASQAKKRKKAIALKMRNSGWIGPRRAMPTGVSKNDYTSMRKPKGAAGAAGAGAGYGAGYAGGIYGAGGLMNAVMNAFMPIAGLGLFGGHGVARPPAPLPGRHRLDDDFEDEDDEDLGLDEDDDELEGLHVPMVMSTIPYRRAPARPRPAPATRGRGRGGAAAARGGAPARGGRR